MSAYGSGYAIDIPRLPVGAMFESVINWLRNNLAALFDIIGDVIDSSVAALSGFLTDPSAAQLTLIACLVIAIGLIRRGQLRLVGVLVAAYLALVLLEASRARSRSSSARFRARCSSGR